MAELDSDKGIGLIRRVKRGQGLPTLIYVMNFIDVEEQASLQEPENEAEPESDSTEESDLEADLEAESAEETTGVVLSDVFAVHLAGGQADSIMGHLGMARNSDCARVAVVIALSDYMAPTEDEAYFRVWEALNATLTAQAESGAAAANCVFTDGTITVWI